MAARDPHRATDEAAWLAARRLDTFTYAALSAEAGIGIDRAMRLTKSWCRTGAVEALGRQGGNKLRFRVVPERAPALAPVRAPSPRVNMWRTMRALRSAFTPTDIAAHATTDSVRVTREEAQGYCQALVRAGYLRVARKAAPPRREAVYRLVRDTGPLPPAPRRVSAIWDPNLREFTHLPEVL